MAMSMQMASRFIWLDIALLVSKLTLLELRGYQGDVAAALDTFRSTRMSV